MSARLQVEELRAELHHHRLDVSGYKPALVQRLDAANHKEEKAVADWDDVVMGGEGNGDNKWKRRTGNVEEEGNGDASSESMGYRELQGFAKARGLAANQGKELFEKLLLAPVDASVVADGGVRTIWKLQQVAMKGLRTK